MRPKPGQLFIHLEAIFEASPLRVIITENLEGLHIIGIFADKTLDEPYFHIEVPFFFAR